jgi:hypothetical protein
MYLCMLFIYHHYSVFTVSNFSLPDDFVLFFSSCGNTNFFFFLDYKTGFGGEYGVQSGMLNYKI